MSSDSPQSLQLASQFILHIYESRPFRLTQGVVFCLFVKKCLSIIMHSIRIYGFNGSLIRTYKYLVQKTILFLRKSSSLDKMVKKEVAKTIATIEVSKHIF